MCSIFVQMKLYSLLWIVLPLVTVIAEAEEPDCSDKTDPRNYCVRICAVRIASISNFHRCVCCKPKMNVFAIISAPAAGTAV
jgi:hypothetical protein